MRSDHLISFGFKARPPSDIDMNTVFYDEETKSFSIRSVMVSSKVVRAELDRAVEITQRFHSEWDEGIQTEHPLTQYTWLAYSLMLYYILKKESSASILLPYAELVDGPLLALVRLDNDWSVTMGSSLPIIAEELRRQDGLTNTLPPVYHA